MHGISHKLEGFPRAYCSVTWCSAVHCWASSTKRQNYRARFSNKPKIVDFCLFYSVTWGWELSANSETDKSNLRTMQKLIHSGKPSKPRLRLTRNARVQTNPPLIHYFWTRNLLDSISDWKTLQRFCLMTKLQSSTRKNYMKSQIKRIALKNKVLYIIQNIQLPSLWKVWYVRPN